MTREEAIQELQNCKGLIQQDGQDYLDERDVPLLDMAIEALSAEHKHCWDCKHYEPKYNVCHDPEVVKQVTSKLKNPCDSLLTEESNGSKEHKSKLDLISRQDVIEALGRSSVYAWSIEQDQTAHNWALNIIKALPSADITLTETCEKCQETTERVLNNQGKKIKICAYCKYKGKEQKTDTEGFTYYRWFCELTGENIEATGTCERWEPNG